MKVMLRARLRFAPAVLAVALVRVASLEAQAVSDPVRQPVGVEIPLRGAPAGDTIALIRAGAAPAVVESSGDWARVRVEGWVEREVASAFAAVDGFAPLSLADLRSHPRRYEGESVRWRVQFVALQRADHLRSDMEPGAHYMLARDPGGEPGFVYAVVPPDLAPVVGTLSPLQRVEIVGRVRTGSSPLTGHPILDLLEINQPRVER